MADTIDWRPPPQPQRRTGLFFMAIAGLLLLAGIATLSYYVEALWFGSLGVADVFWKTLNLRAEVFVGFALFSFLVLYGAFRALKPPRLGDLAGLPIMINGQPIRLPVEPVIKGVALVASVLIAAAMGAGMTAQWATLALYWHGRAESVRAAAGSVVDPIFGQPLPFYLFTLPAWQLVSGWVMTLAVRVYLGRYERLFADHTIFSGVTYTDAHVTLTGMLAVRVTCASV